MRRNGAVSVLLCLALLPLGATAAHAASPIDGSPPRLPQSAADWATFTAQQKDAALAWEQAQYWRLLAAGELTPDMIATGTATGAASLAGSPLASVTAYGTCEIVRLPAAGGWFTRADGQTFASATVYWIDTGGSGVQDRFSKNYIIIQRFESPYNGSGSWAEGNALPDWTWIWEHPTYTVETFHTAWDYLNGYPHYYLGPNAYCTTTMHW